MPKGPREGTLRLGRVATPAIALGLAALVLLPVLAKSGIWDPYELDAADLARRIAINTFGAADLALPKAANGMPTLSDLRMGELPFTSMALAFKVFGVRDWSGACPRDLGVRRRARALRLPRAPRPSPRRALRDDRARHDAALLHAGADDARRRRHDERAHPRVHGPRRRGVRRRARIDRAAHRLDDRRPGRPRRRLPLARPDPRDGGASARRRHRLDRRPRRRPRPPRRSPTSSAPSRSSPASWRSRSGFVFSSPRPTTRRSRAASRFPSCGDRRSIRPGI